MATKRAPLASGVARGTLVHRIGRIADNARGIATRLGARPFRVFMVWEQWSGGERGEGTVTTTTRIELLPTPKIENIDALVSPTTIAGTIPTGNIRIRDVSSYEYTQEVLSGTLMPNQSDKIPDPYNFFYEVVEDDRHGVNPRRMSFRLTAPPALIATSAMYVLLLERISEDRNRAGDDQHGEDQD